MTFECIMCCEDFFDEKKVTKIKERYICKTCMIGHPSKRIQEKIKFIEDREE